MRSQFIIISSFLTFSSLCFAIKTSPLADSVLITSEVHSPPVANSRSIDALLRKITLANSRAIPVNTIPESLRTSIGIISKDAIINPKITGREVEISALERRGFINGMLKENSKFEKRWTWGTSIVQDPGYIETGKSAQATETGGINQPGAEATPTSVLQAPIFLNPKETATLSLPTQIKVAVDNRTMRNPKNAHIKLVIPMPGEPITTETIPIAGGMTATVFKVVTATAKVSKKAQKRDHIAFNNGKMQKL